MTARRRFFVDGTLLNLSSEGLDIEEYITDDTKKVVWVIHIPKHLAQTSCLCPRQSMATDRGLFGGADTGTIE
jgi:hypothetical protein